MDSIELHPKQNRLMDHALALILSFATFSGLALSVASLLKICSACSLTGQYRIFGLNFGWFGIGSFIVLALAVALRKHFRWCLWLAVMLLFASAGAEARFIWIQKYDIGQWCPICLSIAACIFLSCGAITAEVFRSHISQGAPMKTRLLYCLAGLCCAVLGLGAAMLGVSRQADAAELDLYLGKTSSPITVYFVSDWFCPACRKLEPEVEKMVPELAKTVRIGFVDFPIHKETLNFTPYNVQFLAHEKDKYLSLRKALASLALKSKAPSEAEVQAAIAPLGVKARPVNNSDTLYGMQFNLMTYRGYNVTSTPTAVITSSKTKKTKLLVGDRDINLAAIKAAIAEVGQ